MSGVIRASSLVGFSELLVELGGDPERLMQRWHLPPDIALRPDEFIPYKSLANMLEILSQELHCPDIGMRLAGKQGLAVLGPIAVMAQNAETVADAFADVVRYLYVHTPSVRARLEQPSGYSQRRLVIDIIEPGLLRSIQAAELAVAFSMQILRLVGGSQARPTSVFFGHRQVAERAVYRAMFSCPVYFEQEWSGLHLSYELASQKIDSADAQTRELAASYLEDQFANPYASLRSRVETLIRRLLPTGNCSLETIATQLAMHPRTMQRRLLTEDCRFESLLDEYRKALAERYLNQPELPLNQVAAMLGYAEQSAFNRAFKRWYATTPLKYRRANITASRAQ